MKVKDLLDKCGRNLFLKVFLGPRWLQREIVNEAFCPGLALAGFKADFSSDQIVVFGKAEIAYLQTLNSQQKIKSLAAVVSSKTPALVLAENQNSCLEIETLCRQKKVPLFLSSLSAQDFINQSAVLFQTNSDEIVVPGTLVEVFGKGVLLQGDSSIGKSDAALGLLEKGHRLVADDAVKIKRETKSLKLIGTSSSVIHSMLHIRGIGLLNVADLYGVSALRSQVEIDLAIRLKKKQAGSLSETSSSKTNHLKLLQVSIPLFLLPTDIGRNIVLLIETIVLNSCLKDSGRDSAKEFEVKLLKTIRGKSETSQKN